MGRPMDVYEELVHLRRSGQKAALATIVEAAGSIPSFRGSKLLVREDGSMVGTIGGGCTEAEVWNAAREVIETEKPRMLSFNLSQDAAYDSGLICGGQLDVYVEPVMPIPTAYIFGAGHISKAFRKSPRWRDFEPSSSTIATPTRTRSASPKRRRFMPGSTRKSSPKLPINESSYLIIVTRGHRDDMRVLRQAIATPARYVGMIGSKRKLIEVAQAAPEGGRPDRKAARRSLSDGA